MNMIKIKQQGARQQTSSFNLNERRKTMWERKTVLYYIQTKKQ